MSSRPSVGDVGYPAKPPSSRNACSSGYGTGERVGGEGSRVTAEHIAWKLVEQNEQRKRALRAFLPVRKFSGGGRFVRIEESLANLCVEGCVLDEPAVVSGLE